ncbi:MAG: TetR/AcrR family transcriptional regulator [Solirubrobacteraceae bacterium]|nr:TetR/AcrR family transcriptional regulator [Solirubrobacteraceae bacterium]
MDTTKPLRADAARNREAILRAAAGVLARDGLDFRIDEVARSAGVGNATLYRHFPDQAALAEAVLSAKISAYADGAERAAQLAPDDPALAFTQLVEQIAAHQASDRAFAQVVGGAVDLCPGELRRAFNASLEVCRVAQQAQVIRADFEHADLLLLVRAIDGLLHADASTAPSAAHRLSTLFLDAVRLPAAHTELPASTSRD